MSSAEKPAANSAMVEAGWPVSLVADYGAGNDDLRSLYRKAATQQWNAEHDLDWNIALDPANPLKIPDETIELYGTAIWRRLGDKERAALRHGMQAWRLSQILHGEQASVLCAAKIAQGESDVAGKLCAAAQMMDEARHVEVYLRLLDEHFSVIYPLDPALKALLDDILRDTRHDITNLGFQILVEGTALASFRRIHAYSQEPFIKQLVSYVLRDEARHFAAGRAMFRAHAERLSAAELAEREDFVCEAAMHLHDHVFADEMWGRLDLPRAECAEAVRSSQRAQNIHRSLFRQLVPAIKEAGLLGSRAVKVFEQLGVIEYAAIPVPDFSH